MSAELLVLQWCEATATLLEEASDGGQEGDHLFFADSFQDQTDLNGGVFLQR